MTKKTAFLKCKFICNELKMLHLKTGCGCNEEGRKNGTHTCDQETGTCFCENGWFGEKCYLGKFIQKF